MKHQVHRWLFSVAFAALAVGAGWLFVDADSPLALGRIAEDIWRVASFVPLFISIIISGREHDVPLAVALPALLCWWWVVGFTLSYLIWKGHDTPPPG
jgi:hypothetical protein